jgi:adenylate cyclase
MPKKIVYYDLNNEFHEYVLKKNYITIGRKEDNDIVLRDLFVSRYHCNILFDNNLHSIMDKGSKFGTLLNNEKIEKAVLKKGDEIKIGNITFYFIDADEKFQKKKRTKRQKGMALDSTDELDLIISSISDSEEDVNTERLNEVLNNIKMKQIVYQRKLKNYQVMYRVGTMINSIFDFNILLKMVLDLAIEVIEGDRGYIMLRDSNTGKDTISVNKNIDNPQKFLSRSIIKKIEKEENPIIINQSDLTSKDYGESALISNISSAIMSPLLNKDMEFMGMIYVDRKLKFTSFNENDIDLLKIFSSYVSISIENSQLFDKVREEEKIKINLNRYLSPAIADMIAKSVDIKLGGKEMDISIMFIDIRNFTPMSEKLKPKEVVSLLNNFFEFTAQYIFKYNGTLDKFIGDCVMTIYGAPINDKLHADNAVQTALDIKKNFLKQFKKMAKKEYNVELDIGIGINSGPAIVGNIGTSQRMDFTAISDTVNTAERLESNSKNASIYISESTKNKLKGKYKIISKGEMKLKGKENLFKVFEVVK